MRVTNKMLVATVLANLQQNVAALDKTQNQISKGKRVTRPADDPTAAGLGIRLRDERARQNQYLRNIDQARNWLAATERAMSDVTDSLARIRELTVQAANDTYTTSNRTMIAQEVESLRDHILETLNSTVYVDQHIFAGLKTTTVPFTKDAAGNVTYNGDTGISTTGATDLVTANGIDAITSTTAESAAAGVYKVTVTAAAGGSSNVTITRYSSAAAGATVISQQTKTVAIPAPGATSSVDFTNLGVTMTVNSNLGSTAFTDSATSTFTVSTVSREIGPGSVMNVSVFGSKFTGIFADLKNLGDTLTNPSSTPAQISAFLTNLDADSDAVLSTRAEVGAKLNRLDFTQARMEALETQSERLQSVNEDLDFAEALTRLTTQQGVYRASLEAGARVAPMSILDFLR